MESRNKFDVIAEEIVKRMKNRGISYYIAKGEHGKPKDEPFICLASKTGRPEGPIYQWMIDGQVVREYDSRKNRSYVTQRTSPDMDFAA